MNRCRGCNSISTTTTASIPYCILSKMKSVLEKSSIEADHLLGSVFRICEPTMPSVLQHMVTIRIPRMGCNH